MAEALLKMLDADHFEAASAGILQGRLHPYAVEVMKEIGIDLQDRRPKAVQDVADRSFDFVITLCDRARSERPDFEGAECVHWQLDDPSIAVDEVKRMRMFQSLRDQIAQRLRLFTLVQVRFAPQHGSSAA
jgi:arsenate reductase